MAILREYQTGQAVAAGEALVEITEASGGNLVATLSWGEWFSDGLRRHGDSLGPMPVGEALRKAEEIAELYELERVIVSLPSGETWNPAWGEVHREAATGSDDIEWDEADDGDEGRSPLRETPEDDDGPAVIR